MMNSLDNRGYRINNNDNESAIDTIIGMISDIDDKSVRSIVVEKKCDPAIRCWSAGMNPVHHLVDSGHRTLKIEIEYYEEK